MKRRLAARRAELPAGGPERRGRLLGSSTRGKTAPGRLRQVDAFCLLYAGELLRRPARPDRCPCFVDLGYGQVPWTTLAAARAFRRLAPDLRVVGLEIDRSRVTSAAAFATPDTCFRLGGFELGLGRDAAGRQEEARLLRAFNVLRQYEAQAVLPALRAMGRGMEEGGLLLEGSSDPEGRLWSAHLWRRIEGRLDHEGLVFGLRGEARGRPLDLPSVLPKDLIHRMGEDGEVAAFFGDWRRAWLETAGLATWGPARHLAASVHGLRAGGWSVDARRRWLGRGLVLWRGACGLEAIDLRT